MVPRERQRAAPAAGQTLEDLVAAHWEILGPQPSADVAQMIIDVADPLRGLRAYPIHEVWACIEKIRGAGGPTRQSRHGTCVTPSGNC